MPYIPVRCHLAKTQIQKLLTGHPITIRGDQCGDGPHVIHLTKTQVVSLGKNSKVKLSGSQIKHNLKHGSGLDDVVDVLKDLASAGIKFGANQAGNSLGSVVEGAIGAIPVIGGPLGGYAKKGIEWGARKGGDKLSELALGRGIKGRKRKGRGIFGSLGNALKSTGNVVSSVLETAVPVGTALDYVGNKIIGNGFGGALYPPGYGIGRGLLPPPIRGSNSGAAGI